MKQKTTPNQAENFMRRALDLAAQGRYTASPNPRVGAVVVQGDRIVGEGWHQRPGTLHAEPQALAEAGPRARGATLFVNLEPCIHHGRTPPCCPAIVAAGIRTVYVACPDPDERVHGKGLRFLEDQGLEVHLGLLAKEASLLNEKYFKHRRTGLPFITLKAALTLDGKLATRTGDSRWVSSEEARRAAHLLRAEHDAVMVGANTLNLDDPQLTVRLPDLELFRQPARIVVDSKLRSNPQAKAFADVDGARRIVICSEDAPFERMSAFQRAGVELFPVPRLENGRLALEGAFRRMAGEEITSVLVEGGGETHAALLQQGFGDKIWFVYSPKLCGGRTAPTAVDGEGVAAMAEALEVKQLSFTRLGPDLLVQGYVFGREPDCLQDWSEK